MRRGEKTPDDLQRPQGNGLKANYEKHDVGEAEFLERANAIGWSALEWGIDKRNDSGEDGIIYDEAMDFALFDDEGDLIGLADVKTKGSPKYMGRFNLRHYNTYAEHAAEVNCPVFVVMFQVDYRANTIEDEFVFHVSPEDAQHGVKTSKESRAVDPFPDGNHAVLVPHNQRQLWESAIARVEAYKDMKDWGAVE